MAVLVATDKAYQAPEHDLHLVTVIPLACDDPLAPTRSHTPPARRRAYLPLLFTLSVAATLAAYYAFAAPRDERAGGEIRINLALQSFRQRSDTMWLGCDELSTVSDVKYLAGGWTKAVFTANYRLELQQTNETPLPSAHKVALKTLLQNGTQIQRCLAAMRFSTPTDDDYQFCYQKAKDKLVKEAFLLSQLSHPGIVRLHGYCNVNEHGATAAESASQQSVAQEQSPDSIIVVTELGQPFNLLDLLQMPWLDRLQITINLLDILDYFAQKGLVLNDLRQSQFVLVDGQLKLTDLDDINQVAGRDSPESYQLGRLDRANASTVQLADKQNLQSAYRHFFKFILTHGPPRSLRRFTRSFRRSIATQQYSSKFYALLLRDTALDQVRRLPDSAR